MIEGVNAGAVDTTVCATGVFDGHVHGVCTAGTQRGTLAPHVRGPFRGEHADADDAEQPGQDETLRTSTPCRSHRKS